MSPKTRLSKQLSLVTLFLGVCGVSGGCSGGTVDVSVSRGAQSFRFSGGDCTTHLTGLDINGVATAVDLSCPDNLIPPRDGATLHLSVPLGIAGKDAVQIRDDRFGEAGRPPGQLVVVTYRQGAEIVSCNPKQASGSVTYYELPKPGSSGRLIGTFSADAALLSCSGSDSNPLKLSGRFDMIASQ